MPIDIQVPVTAVVGIYSQENGQGMVFEHEPSDDLPPTPPTPPTPPSGPKAVKKTSTQSPATPSDKAPKKIKPSLRVIK
jgi:stringent starvation protein B